MLPGAISDWTRAAALSFLASGERLDNEGINQQSVEFHCMLVRTGKERVSLRFLISALRDLSALHHATWKESRRTSTCRARRPTLSRWDTPQPLNVNHNQRCFS
jgi:hypothetical protein